MPYKIKTFLFYSTCNTFRYLRSFSDLLANLQLSVDDVIKVISNEDITVDSDYTSDSEENPSLIQCNEQLTTSVRKNLCNSLKLLLEHGLNQVCQDFVSFLL